MSCSPPSLLRSDCEAAGSGATGGGELRLRGMAAAFDEAVVHGIRQRRTVEEILGELLRAEAAERQSRSIRYRLGIAGLPEMKDLDIFRFDLSPVNG